MTTTLATLHENGRPVLVHPAEVPPMGPRLVALAVDQLLVVVGCLVATAAWLAAGSTGRSLLVVWLVTGLLIETGQAFAEAVSGATLGGALTHVRTVSARTGWPAGLIAVVVRRLVLTAAGVVLPVVGAYVVAGSGKWDGGPAHRGWHDWVADTLVLRAWAVPDQAERAAEQARRTAARAARTADSTLDSAEPSLAPADPGAADPDRAVPDGADPDGAHPDGAAPDGAVPDGANPGADPDGAVPDGAVPDGADPDGAVPDGADPDGADPDGAGSNAEWSEPAGPDAEGRVSSLEGADGRASGQEADGVPDSAASHGSTVEEDEPLDHRTATTVDVRPAGQGPATSEPDTGAQSSEESIVGLTSVVPIVVPDVRSELEQEHPRARHRATVLGLGRPRPHTPSGRHRVPEIPTQRTAPRTLGGWPQFVDDDPTRSATGAGLRLVFDSGVRVEVVGNGAVGRDLSSVLPPPLHAVVVDDPKRTVSRVHLRFGPNPGQDALWVMDENSTNGTILVRPDGGARVLPAGVPAVVGAGWEIRFGERSAVVERSSLRASSPSTDPVEQVCRLNSASASLPRALGAAVR